MNNLQNRGDYGGGFLYGQPELFGSLSDGLLASVSGGGGNGGASRSSENGGDTMKPLLRPGGGLHLDSASGFGSGGSTGGVSVTATIQSSSSSHNARQHQVCYCLFISSPRSGSYRAQLIY